MALHACLLLMGSSCASRNSAEKVITGVLQGDLSSKRSSITMGTYKLTVWSIPIHDLPPPPPEIHNPIITVNASSI